MKNKMALIFIAVMALVLTGCGAGQQDSKENEEEASEYAQALDVLNAVVDTYAEEDLFSMYGGDSEHAVMDAPGTFDIQKKEELTDTFGFPESEYDKIDGAASMVHMMNANTFTGVVYHLKDSTDMDAFADALKENVLSKQWVCGQPDTLVLMRVGNAYVIAVYGEAGLVETFQTNVLSAVDGAQVMTETPIV
ncbi:MAG: hypothetical protein HFJ05_01930 [Eubacterium sp.]|nr:hypothetical protein [Eubacterium sp.]